MKRAKSTRRVRSLSSRGSPTCRLHTGRRWLSPSSRSAAAKPRPRAAGRAATCQRARRGRIEHAQPRPDARRRGDVALQPCRHQRRLARASSVGDRPHGVQAPAEYRDTTTRCSAVCATRDFPWKWRRTPTRCWSRSHPGWSGASCGIALRSIHRRLSGPSADFTSRRGVPLRASRCETTIVVSDTLSMLELRPEHERRRWRTFVSLARCVVAIRQRRNHPADWMQLDGIIA